MQWLQGGRAAALARSATACCCCGRWRLLVAGPAAGGWPATAGWCDWHFAAAGRGAMRHAMRSADCGRYSAGAGYQASAAAAAEYYSYL